MQKYITLKIKKSNVRLQNVVNRIDKDQKLVNNIKNL